MIINMSNTESKSKIGYLEGPGTFSCQAAERLGQSLNLKNDGFIYLPTIEEVVSGVGRGDFRWGVIPQENPRGDYVKGVLDYLRKYPVRIIGEYILPLTQCLFYLPDANIKTLASKDNALDQCSGNIAKKFGSGVERRAVESTKKGVEMAALDPTIAGIGCFDAAERSELPEARRLIRIENFQDDPYNATRFIALVGPDEEIEFSKADKTTILLAAGNQPGSLYKCLSELAEGGINLSQLKSFARTDDKVWFLMSFDGKIRESRVNKVIARFFEESRMMKFLGSYEADKNIPQYPHRQDPLDELATKFHPQQDTSTVLFTLDDKVGALAAALKPFREQEVNLLNINSLQTGRLGEYAFLVEFANHINQRQELLDEMTRVCRRVVVLG